MVYSYLFLFCSAHFAALGLIDICNFLPLCCSRPKRPGDKGFIARARVPRPSNRDYIVRPKSDVSFGEFGNVKVKHFSSHFELGFKWL